MPTVPGGSSMQYKPTLKLYLQKTRRPSTKWTTRMPYLYTPDITPRRISRLALLMGK